MSSSVSGASLEGENDKGTDLEVSSQLQLKDTSRFHKKPDVLPQVS